jgi:hypothetical protein
MQTDYGIRKHKAMESDASGPSLALQASIESRPEFRLLHQRHLQRAHVDDLFAGHLERPQS